MCSRPCQTGQRQLSTPWWVLYIHQGQESTHRYREFPAHSFDQPFLPAGVCYRRLHPNQVVFDEVHFGKFAAFYIRREYFFDVHPPFAKLLLAFAGWLAGFDGKFEFENIGDKYVDAGVPYIKMRALPALLGSLQIPLVYAIMRETGHAPTIAAFSALLLLLDKYRSMILLY